MAAKKPRKTKVDQRLRAKVQVGQKPDGAPIYKWVGATTQRELEKKKADLVKRYVTGIDSGTITLGEYIEKQWLPGRLAGLAPATANKLVSVCNAVVLPAYGARFIRSLTKAELIALLEQEQSKGRSASHLSNTAMVLREVMGSAQADGLLAINPAYNLKSPSSAADPHRKRALTEAETRATLEVINAHPDGLLLALLYYLGLRRGEALGLRWEDFDFAAHTITIQRDIDFAAPLGDQVGDVKTESSRRVVAMPEAAENRCRAARGIGWVFCRADGQPWREADFKRAWRDLQKALAAAAPEITQADGRSILTPHYYRHNYATLLHRAGVSPEQARDWLGHSSIAVTMDIYTHLDQVDGSKAAAALATVFGN